MQPSIPYPASKTKTHKFHFSDTTKICGFQKSDISSMKTINSGGFVDPFHKVWKFCGKFSTTFPQTGKIMDTKAIEAAPAAHPLFYHC